jgi:hypothetical protein
VYSVMPRFLYRYTFVLCLLAALLAPSTMPAQEPPMNLDTLKRVLAVGEEVVPTAEVVARVKKEGVDFFLDADMKTELILAAAAGRRSEGDTLTIINVLADACVPCKERMEGPIGAELALTFLKEKVRSRDIISEIRRRGLAEEVIAAEQLAALREAGASDAMILLMKPNAEPLVGSEYKQVPVQKSGDFDDKRPYGSIDIRVRVDETVDFRLAGSELYYKVEAGQDLKPQNSVITGALPRVPADAIAFTFSQRGGRSKAEPPTLEPADVFGFPALTFRINDEKSRDANYRFEINWQLKPYTRETLVHDAEELSGSHPELLAEMVRRRGFMPPFTSEDEAALKEAGVGYELMYTIRGSIRPANNPPR